MIISFQQLAEMTPQEVADLPPDVLLDLQEELASAKAIVTLCQRNLEAGLGSKYEDAANAARHADGKDTGSVTIQDGLCAIKANLPKKVDWDQGKLVQVFNSMDREEAAHFAKVTYKVEEKKFSAATPMLQEKLMDARTVSTGKATYKLEGKFDA